MLNIVRRLVVHGNVCQNLYEKRHGNYVTVAYVRMGAFKTRGTQYLTRLAEHYILGFRN